VEIRFLPPARKAAPIGAELRGEKPDIFESATAFTPSGTELREYVALTSAKNRPGYRIVLQDGNLSLTRLKRKQRFFGQLCTTFLPGLAQCASRVIRGSASPVWSSTPAAFELSIEKRVDKSLT